MDSFTINRQQIAAALLQALEPVEYVHAMWEGGSAAFGRADQWSDLDLQVDVEDEHAAEVFPLVEAALEQLSPIELRYEIPQPSWHGHAQVFYRLRDAGPFLMVDLAVMKHSSSNKFLERELHGEALVYFDRCGATQPPTFDQTALQQRLQARLADLRLRFEMFQNLVVKEFYRQHPLDALVSYHSLTLRPLVEVLRMQHQPARHEFGPRYIYVDLPAEDALRLEELYFVASLEDLQAKHDQAQAWFQQVSAALANKFDGRLSD